MLEGAQPSLEVAFGQHPGEETACAQLQLLAQGVDVVGRHRNVARGQHVAQHPLHIRIGVSLGALGWVPGARAHASEG